MEEKVRLRDNYRSSERDVEGLNSPKAERAEKRARMRALLVGVAVEWIWE